MLQAGSEEATKAKQDLAAKEEALSKASHEKDQQSALIKELQE
jgi:hypothetical protein